MAPPPNLDQLLVQMQFPGMPRPESDVLKEWLVRRGADYDRIDFNVRLGKGVDLGEGFTPETKDLANKLTQKRADLVAWKFDVPTIIEVKIRASLGALGQLLGYRTLWPLTYPDTAEPGLLVIARRVDDDAALVLSEHGVDVILYEG